MLFFKKESWVNIVNVCTNKSIIRIQIKFWINGRKSSKTMEKTNGTNISSIRGIKKSPWRKRTNCWKIHRSSAWTCSKIYSECPRSVCLLWLRPWWLCFQSRLSKNVWWDRDCMECIVYQWSIFVNRYPRLGWINLGGVLFCFDWGWRIDSWLLKDLGWYYNIPKSYEIKI